MERDDSGDVLAVAACLRDAVRSKDVSVALSLMTDDVIIMGPAGPPLVGHEAVRNALFVPARWRQDVEETVNDISVEVLGRIAIVMRNGCATGSLTIGRASLPAITMSGRTISVFRRQVDGWKLARWLNLMEKAQEQRQRGLGSPSPSS
jgi:ketosteroid isomerase-like protein